MRAQKGRFWGFAAVLAGATALLAGSPEKAAGPTGPAPVAAPAPPAARAPSCSAEPDPADAAAVAAMVEALRRLPPRRTPDGEEVVTLDNRGFGYGGSPGPFALPPAARRR